MNRYFESREFEDVDGFTELYKIEHDIVYIYDTLFSSWTYIGEEKYWKHQYQDLCKRGHIKEISESEAFVLKLELEVS